MNDDWGYSFMETPTWMNLIQDEGISIARCPPNPASRRPFSHARASKPGDSLCLWWGCLERMEKSTEVVFHFSRMRSQGFLFYILGVWGLRRVRVTLLLVSATVRASPSWQKSCRVYGGSHKNVSFSTCQKMCSCRFAWQVGHFVTFDLFQEECVCATVVRVKLACLWGKCQKIFWRGTLWHYHSMCLRRNVCTYTPHSTLYTPHFTLYTLHSTLYTPKFTLHTSHFTLHTFHTSLHTPHFTLSTPDFTHLTPHSTLYTPHSTLRTLHSTLYTPHFTLYTSHSTLHTLHFTLYTPRFALYIYTPHLSHLTPLYTLHSPLHTPHFTLHSLHSTLFTPHFTLYTLHFILHTPHSSFHTLHSTLHTPHFTLYTLHSTHYTLHFTLHTIHFTLSTLHSTL